MDRPEVCHVCVLLTLIRAAGGLTRCGRPPLHSRDGHSQPVNPTCCMRLWQKAPKCGVLTMRWRRHRGFKSQLCRHAQKDRQTSLHRHPHVFVSRPHPVLPSVCSGTEAGLSDCQSHWWVYSAVSKCCPPTFLWLFLPIRKYFTHISYFTCNIKTQLEDDTESVSLTRYFCFFCE